MTDERDRGKIFSSINMDEKLTKDPAGIIIMLTSITSAGHRTIRRDLGDRDRIIRPRRAANFHLEIVVVVDLLYPANFTQRLKQRGKKH